MVWISGVGRTRNGDMAVGYTPSKMTLVSLTSAHRLENLGVPREIRDRYSLRPSRLKRQRSTDALLADYLTMYVNGSEALTNVDLDIYVIRAPLTGKSSEPRHDRDRRASNYGRLVFTYLSGMGGESLKDIHTMLEDTCFTHADERQMLDTAAFWEQELGLLRELLDLYDARADHIEARLAVAGYAVTRRSSRDFPSWAGSRPLSD